MKFADLPWQHHHAAVVLPPAQFFSFLQPSLCLGADPCDAKAISLAIHEGDFSKARVVGPAESSAVKG
jgi:hypothetical protein